MRKISLVEIEIMQLQIECNRSSLKNQCCCLCKQQFELREARVIACNEQGEGYGEVCPDCIAKGYTWIKNRFQQLSYQDSQRSSA